MDPPETASNGQSKTRPPRERLSNTLALWLMALATLGSSWSGYQASLWDGRQSFALADASALGREANEKEIIAYQQRTLDASLFVEYTRNLKEGKSRLNDFFLARMRPDFRQAIQAWAATNPLVDPAAPATPFVMPQYRVQAEIDSKELSIRSQALYDQARKANLTGDTYALLTVLYTAGLFLAGLVGGFEQRRSRRTLLLLSLAVVLLATFRLVWLPVASLG